MLEIRLLGSPQVTVDSVQVEVDTRKAIAMLAYLTVEQSADRDTLANLFWAESSPERSRATLRRTLSSLRSGIGPSWIQADRNRVTVTEGYACDFHEFTTEIEETTHHDHDPNDVCSKCIPHLATAADLYRGDFLGTFSVRDAPDFEDWARTVAESLRLQAGDALRRLSMAHASAGDYTAAIAAANRWIKLDELHEPAHRMLMLLRAWDGDRAGSIQAYRDCVAVLDRELGVAPLEETTELHEAILDEDLPPAPGLRRPVRTHPAPRRPLPSEMIGRTEEAQTIRDVIATIEPPGRLLVISGASWMGKTRLIEHIVDVAAELDVAPVSGRAFRPESMLPYGVATQLLESILKITGDSDLPVPDWVLAELARLNPKLAPIANDGETADLGQLRLREAFLELVEAAAEDRPIIITIDDAQWMDSASATLVSYVQRRSQRLRTLHVVSTRDVESLHPAMRESAEEADHTIALQPLTPADLTAQHPDIDTVAIIRATGGIPLLVKQALDSKAVTPDAESVAKFMESRRRRLSDLADQVMAAAAVLDGMCDAQLLRDTSGRTEDEIVDAVEELVTAGLLREHPDGKLGFTLEALEAATYESTSLIRRRLLHKRAADALQARPRSQTDAILATAAAEHLRDAGSDEAAEWYLLAGDLSRAVFAHDEAVSAYETAIALGHSDHGGIRLALGELAIERGDYETAIRELRSAASQSTDATLAIVEHRTGSLHRVLGRFDLAEESFIRAEPDHPNPSELYADWALLRYRLGDSADAMTMANRALEAADESDDRNRARGLNILGVVTPDTDEAMVQIDKALELAGSVEPARMAALNNKAHLLGGQGDIDAAAVLVNEAIEIASKAGYRHQEAALLNHLADLHHQSGRESEAQQALKEAVTIFADIDSGEWQPEVWLLRQW
jgi:DNA-binding SARP family transcriptional activator/tetratricopeptide (TPR) repeat protein